MLMVVNMGYITVYIGFTPIQDRHGLNTTFHMSEQSSSTPNNTLSTSHNETKTGIDTLLVHWEEFALCIEEHFHAQEMFNRKPHGKPMGHR